MLSSSETVVSEAQPDIDQATAIIPMMNFNFIDCSDGRTINSATHILSRRGIARRLRVPAILLQLWRGPGAIKTHERASRLSRLLRSSARVIAPLS
jgi:hypothetical protein